MCRLCSSRRNQESLEFPHRTNQESREYIPQRVTVEEERSQPQ